mgnify:CR=1 FL=1
MPNYPLARKQAENLLTKFKINTPPVDPEAIAEASGIDVVYVQFAGDLDDEISGFFDFESDTIYVNKNLPANRKTFTIAHELAHAMMHKEYAKSKDYIALPRLNVLKEKSDVEKEADVFAACLLVPKKMLKNFSHYASIPELSRMFAVSEEVVAHQKKYI